MKLLAYGTKVRDEVTGVEGVVTGFAYYYGKETDVYRIEYLSANNALCQDWIQAHRLVVIK